MKDQTRLICISAPIGRHSDTAIPVPVFHGLRMMVLRSGILQSLRIEVFRASPSHVESGCWLVADGDTCTIVMRAYGERRRCVCARTHCAAFGRFWIPCATSGRAANERRASFVRSPLSTVAIDVPPQDASSEKGATVALTSAIDSHKTTRRKRP